MDNIIEIFSSSVKRVVNFLWSSLLWIARTYHHAIMNLLYFWRANHWRLSLVNNIVNVPLHLWLITYYKDLGNEAGAISFFVLFILSCVGLVNDLLFAKKGIKREKKWIARGMKPTFFNKTRKEYEPNQRLVYIQSEKLKNIINVGNFELIELDLKKKRE